MKVVSTVTNFVTSSQSDGTKPLKIMMKLRGWSPYNEPVSSQMNHSSFARKESTTKVN
jgi:hypothetical protein